MEDTMLDAGVSPHRYRVYTDNKKIPAELVNRAYN